MISRFPSALLSTIATLVLLFSSAVLCLIFCLPAYAAQPLATSYNPDQKVIQITPQVFKQCEFSSGGSLVKVDGQRLFVEAYSCKGSKIIKNYDPNIANKPLAKPEPLHLASVFLPSTGINAQINDSNSADFSVPREVKLLFPNGQKCAEIQLKSTTTDYSSVIPFDYQSLSEEISWKNVVDYLADTKCQNVAVSLGSQLAIVSKPGVYKFHPYNVSIEIKKFAASNLKNTNSIALDPTSIKFLDQGDSGYQCLYKLGNYQLRLSDLVCATGELDHHQSSKPNVDDPLKLKSIVGREFPEQRFKYKDFDNGGQTLLIYKKDGSLCSEIHVKSTREPIPIPGFPNDKEWEKMTDYMVDDDCKFVAILVIDRGALFPTDTPLHFNLNRLDIRVTQPR